MKGLRTAERKGDGHIKERLAVLGVHTSGRRDGETKGLRGASNAADYVGICMRWMQPLSRSSFLSALLHRAIASSLNDMLNI